VKSHQDTKLTWKSLQDFAKLDLAMHAKLNILCDKNELIANKTGVLEPNVAVLPAEC
jgi:hypothetical protein